MRPRCIRPRWLAGVLLLVAAPPDLVAQRRSPGPASRFLVQSVPEAGVRAGYDFALAAPAPGMQLRVPLGAFAELVPSGDFYLTSGQTAWQVNLDLAFRIGWRQAIYGGVGGALAHRVLEVNRMPLPPERTEFGLNLLAGVAVPRFARLPLRPYFEYRQTFISDFDAHPMAVLGANLPLRRGRPPRPGN